MAESVRSVAMVLGAVGGTAGRHVASLAAELSGRGVGVDVYCAEQSAREYGFARARVMPLDVSGGARDAAAVAALRRALRAEPVDVMHAHGLGRRGGRRARPPVRAAARGHLAHHPGRRRGPQPAAPGRRPQRGRRRPR